LFIEFMLFTFLIGNDSKIISTISLSLFNVDVIFVGCIPIFIACIKIIYKLSCELFTSPHVDVNGVS